jgi:hypothetical protein
MTKRIPKIARDYRKQIRAQTPRVRIFNGMKFVSDGAPVSSKKAAKDLIVYWKFLKFKVRTTKGKFGYQVWHSKEEL